MGITPGGLAATPGLGGFTPGFTPGVAYTPGLDGGIPGTPGFVALDGGAVGQVGQGLNPGGMQGPDYVGVLVKMPSGGVGVAGVTDAAGNTEAVPEGGGPVVLLDIVELCDVERKDWVKVVTGHMQGKVGQVVAFDGLDMVLNTGDVVESGVVGKLAIPPEGMQHGVEQAV